MPPSSLNFAVSDGRSLVVIRFRSSMSEDPPTLYYRRVDEGVIVASEPSSSDAETLKEWTLLGKNRMLSYSPSTGVHVECVCPHSCDDDVSAAAHFRRTARRRRRRFWQGPGLVRRRHGPGVPAGPAVACSVFI